MLIGFLFLFPSSPVLLFAVC